MKLPLSFWGVSTRTKRRLLSSERKYPASGGASPSEKSVPQGDRYGVGLSRRPAIWSSVSWRNRVFSPPLFSRPRSKRFDTNAEAMAAFAPSMRRARLGSPAKLSMKSW
jgi:hypothetical protein